MVNNVLTPHITEFVTESDCVGVSGHRAGDEDIVTNMQMDVLKNDV